MTYATSPDRYSFIIENYKKRLASDPDNVEIKKTLQFYEECRAQDSLDIPRQFDLEYDLRKSKKIIDKCKESETYCQNLYASLCNNIFVKEGKEWSCSWRMSGGLISNLREKGDYIDWYCSGIFSENNYVEEGTITKEVEDDLISMGWSSKING